MALIASRAIGNAGRMEIHDNGTQVQMRFRSSDSQTNSGAIPYRVYVHGFWTEWRTTPYGPGAPWKDVWYGTIAASQSVAFAIGNTGTWGLGAGGELWGAIGRATAPAAPTAIAVDQATATSLRFRFSGNSNGGAPILQWQAQVSAASNFSNPVTITSTGTSVFTGLQPDRLYYFRARGRNSVDWGPWSTVNANARGSTLATPAPGLTVSPVLSGASATVNLSPPNGVSSVTSYRVETRPVGGAVTVHNTTSSSLSLPRSPGTSYEYRASAFIQAYQSPWTGWILVTQPQTNTNPGDYFDGSTAPRGDLSFAWLGTANNSASEARGVSPAGWGIIPEMVPIPVPVPLPGPSARLQRVTGGLFGAHAARLIMIRSTTEPVIIVTSSTSEKIEVAEGGGYTGSVYVNPSRPQRMSLRLTFYTDAGISFPSVSGDVAVVPSGTWTRLTVVGTAPAGAVHATLQIRDTTGAGWSPWLSGEFFDFDGAALTVGSIYPYFDGSTPDTPEFQYDWLGAAHSSVSARTDNALTAIDPLADPDCPPIPSAPLPPEISDSCIDEVTQWRRYWAIIPESEVYDWLTVVPTITLVTGSAAARQVRIRFFANPDSLEPSAAGELTAESEQIVSYIPPAAELVLDGVSRHAWANVGTSENVSADHLLYGADGGPATWPTMDCGSGYLISVDVPLDSPVGDLTVGVALTQRML